MTKPLVSICCLTYNHEPYIAECINGFISQKTDFEFEVLIHDDASTDGTADLIKDFEKKHPNLIKPIYQAENQYSKGIKPTFEFNIPRCKGKYIALCEGDDYWTDPQKLQKQVDFLERNEEYSVCFTETESLVNGKIVGLTNHSKNPREINPREIDIMHVWTKNKGGSTASMLFRREELIQNKLNLYNGFGGDVQITSHLLISGKKACRLPDVTCVYRVGVGIMNNYYDKLDNFDLRKRRINALEYAIVANPYGFTRNQMRAAILRLTLDSMRVVKFTKTPFLIYKYIGNYVHYKSGIGAVKKDLIIELFSNIKEIIKRRFLRLIKCKY